MMLGEDFAQHRQTVLGPVFLIAGDQHDMFALAGTIPAGIADMIRFG